MALIEDKQTNAQSDEYLCKAESAAERISAMIQFTKTYEDIEVNAPWHNIRVLVDKCSREIHAGHVTVINDVPVGIELFSDPLIVKVFYNLIDYAVRHGRTTTLCVYI
jgi:K+-sensing histidine kinase KdpD